MGHRDATSARWVPAEDPPAPAPTVTADIYAVILGATLVTLTAFAVGARLAGWQLATVLVVSLGLFIGLLLAVVLILSGGWRDWLLYRAAVQRLRTEAATEQARLQVEHWRALAQLEDSRTQRQTVQQLTPPPPTVPGYVPAEDTADRQAALTWALSLYGEDGRPDPDRVWPESGALKVKSPWNAGLPPGACELLLHPAHAPPVLVRESRQTRLNLAEYPSAASLARW